MASSPSHKFGQIIGAALEATVEPMLIAFAKEHSLYFDKQGPRTARKGKKVSWVDKFRNSHDLDFVLEHGGSDRKIGKPVAFIESAWRRYTKHSRNKSQEIQGAILPLYETYNKEVPFIGAILAGDFTEGAITQLKSLGFSVLYFPYETLIKAFSIEGIDAFSWKQYVKEPWKHDKWIVMGTDPDSDSSSIVNYWKEKLDVLEQHYTRVFENEHYKIFVKR